MDSLLGLAREPAQLTFLQIAARSVIVFATMLVAIRCGDRRFLSNKTAFDVVLAFLLASMLARAVNGSSAFLPTIGGAFVLVFLHRGVAALAKRSHRFGNLVKGRTDVIVRDGVVDAERMRRNRVSESDLLEGLRLNGNVNDVAKVAVAVLERDGEISVVRR